MTPEQPVTPSNPNNGSSGGSGAAPYDPVTGNVIVDRAYGCIGLPYVWGATGPNSFDCSGLVGYCLTGGYGRVGTTYTFMGWPRVSDPQPGRCMYELGSLRYLHWKRYDDPCASAGERMLR